MTDQTSGHEPDLDRRRVDAPAGFEGALQSAAGAADASHEHAFQREPAAGGGAGVGGGLGVGVGGSASDVTGADAGEAGSAREAAGEGVAGDTTGLGTSRDGASAGAPVAAAAGAGAPTVGSATATSAAAVAAVPASIRRSGVPEPELDRILITRMHARGHHGVFAHERRDGQDFYVDAEAWVDAAAASSSDHIGDTLHYGEWMHALHAIVTGEPVDLIETLAERLAAATFGFDDAVAVRITVHKPQAPVPLDFEDVAVSILRHRPVTASGEYLESAAAHAVSSPSTKTAPESIDPRIVVSSPRPAADHQSTSAGVSTAGSVVPGSAVPGPAVPGSAVPGSALLGSAVPGPAVPGSAVPGSVVPGPAVPGSAVPGSAVPGSAVPSSVVPGSAVPSPAASASAEASAAPLPASAHARAAGLPDVAPPSAESASAEDDFHAREAAAAAHTASAASMVLDSGGAPNVPLPSVEPAGALFSPIAQREQDERSPSDASVVSRAGGAPNVQASEHPRRIRQAVIALGANLGDREATLSSALRSITELPGTKVVAASSLYETPALPLEGVNEAAPAYRNAVVLVDTELPADELMRALHTIEDAHGRTRETRWGSRTLDLDLIQVDGELSDGDLQLPHPRAHERAFVLAPWLEIDPRAQLHPRGSVAALRAAANDRVERVAQ